jgi:hypothetical protein
MKAGLNGQQNMLAAFLSSKILPNVTPHRKFISPFI